MGKNTMVVYDSDEEYVTKLMNFICESRQVPLEVHSFTDRELLRDYVRDNRVDILLVEEGGMDEELECCSAAEKLVLSESDLPTDGKGHRSICKYQSSANILKEVMGYYAERAGEQLIISSRSDTKLIGVYSPVRRCGRTSFALTLGEVLSHNEDVLYVNLEEYSGFNSMLKRSFTMDMSDLLFYIGQKKLNFGCKLSSIVEKIGSLDFIPPSIAPLDLGAVGEDCWTKFFSEVINCNYSKVIIDFGDAVEGLLDILAQCALVYMPVREDAVSKAKVEQYEAMLRILEKDSVLKKTRRLEIPDLGGLNVPLEMLEYTKMGDYVRRLIFSGARREAGMMEAM